ncbi:MAG: hypothetical protein LBL31_01175 [Spirochaetaceae bacterium]|jgi:hypothetical protein|nr:hypothetical protein [Spirochaetaceae bacterium]
MGNNGKKFFLFLLAMGISFNLFAQEGNVSDVKHFSFGAALGFLPDGGGSASFFEFGLLLFHNEKWDIRNHVFIGGARMHDDDNEDNIIFNLNEKISFGGITRNGLFRPYGFVEGGVGFYETETKKLSEMPLAYNFGFGYGLDIFVRDNTSFLVEVGINEHILDKQWLFMQKITIGARAYL